MALKKHFFDESGLAKKGFLNGIKALGSILLFFLFFTLSGFIFHLLLRLGLSEKKEFMNHHEEFMHSIYPQLGMFLAVLLSAFIIKFLFYRKTLKFELKLKGQGKAIVYGGLFVIMIYVIGYLFSVGLGWIEIVHFKWDAYALVSSFILFLLVSFTEEIMCRGVVQQILMDIPIPKFLALGITSGLFMMLHLTNPGIGVIPLLNLFLAGFILGLPLLFSRNLWFPISFHLFWNWIQGPILGYRVSGLTYFSPLIHIRGNGPEWITGGDFGFEGSIICSILLLFAIAILYQFLKKRSLRNINQG